MVIGFSPDAEGITGTESKKRVNIWFLKIETRTTRYFIDDKL
jgi:hypothetical protein